MPKVNAVGYVNLDLPAGFSLIANPLNNGANKLSAVIPTAPEDSIIFTFSNGAFDPVAPQFFGGGIGWDSPDVVIAPGKGFFIQMAAPGKLTFVGEVPQGTLTTAVPAGFSILASQVPQAGKVTTDLGFQAAGDDTVFKFRNDLQRYDDSAPQYFEGVGWDPTEPTLTVGESFFLLRTGTAGSWTRTFTVNN